MILTSVFGQPSHRYSKSGRWKRETLRNAKSEAGNRTARINNTGENSRVPFGTHLNAFQVAGWVVKRLKARSADLVRNINLTGTISEIRVTRSTPTPRKNRLEEERLEFENDRNSALPL